MTNKSRGYVTNWILAAAALLAAAPSVAGVVYEIEVTDYDASPPAADSIQTSIQDRQLKMLMNSQDHRGEMIYRGDKKEMVMVDHEERSYMVMDQQTIAELGAQMSEANRMMAEALKNVPPEQRPMVEQMMKQRMPQMQAAPPQRPRSELKRTGETADHNGYPCVKYLVVQDGRTIRELWVTDWDHVEGGEEVVEVFKEMAEFFEEFLAAIPNMGLGGGPNIDDNMFEYMNQLDGFPVLTREFSAGGSVTGESKLRSAERRTLDPADFEPPSGYKRRSMLPR